MGEEDLYGNSAYYAELLENTPIANYTLRITEKDGAAASMEITVNFKTKMPYYFSDTDDSYMEFHYNITAEAQKATADYSITVNDILDGLNEATFRVHADATSVPTDEAPRTAPPKGAKVFSIYEL
jgi:hypothetical protein